MSETRNEPEDPTVLVGRLLALWGAASGQIRATPGPGDPTPDHVRELGQYVGEALYHIGLTSAGLANDGFGSERRTALTMGVTVEWFTKARAHDRAKPEALAMLAFLAEMVHAALDGVRAADCDIDDAHEYAMRLHGCLAAAAGDSGTVPQAQQITADSAPGER